MTTCLTKRRAKAKKELGGMSFEKISKVWGHIKGYLQKNKEGKYYTSIKRRRKFLEYRDS